jgi:DNA-damage-inducible protein J
MYKNKSIIVKIESSFKERVESIFEELGMTTSQAISIFLKQVELNHGLPFDVKLPSNPNKLTQKTLESSQKGEDLLEFNSFDEWKKDLNNHVNKD